jgi:hypothetical protein
VAAEGFNVNVMGRVVEFRARKLVRKGKADVKKEEDRKVIEFRKQESANNSQNAGTKKPDEAIPQALFFWSF